jgi:hypothetical protein
MKYYIYVAAACVLITIAAGIASASGQSVNVSVPSSFVISEYGKAIDSSSNEPGIGPGQIMFARDDKGLFVRVPASAHNGTRLVSLEDLESGIVFRNNTIMLPVYAAGEKAGSLVATTDNLNAGSDGYSGQVTGLELHLAGIASSRNGTNFTAGAVILLRDLPAGVEYRISFADSDLAVKAISSDLGPKGQTIADMSPPLDLEAVNDASEDAAGYVIVTIQTDRDWPGLFDAGNITFYRYSDGRLSVLKPRLLKTENGTAYQAVAPGTGQFALVVARPVDHAVTEASVTDVGGLAAIGGILATLLFALAVMVRRVTKR